MELSSITSFAATPPEPLDPEAFALMTSAPSFQILSPARACQGYLSNPSLSNEDIPRIRIR
jgi:hypothetical protein